MDELRGKRYPREARANIASDALQLAMLSLRGKRPGEAVRYLERTLELRREMANEDPKNAVAALRVAAALNRMGLAYREWGRYPEAIQYGRESVTAVKTVRKTDAGNLTAGREAIFALSDLALTYEKAGQRNEACKLARETMAVSKEVPVSGQTKPAIERMTRMAAACAGGRR